MDTGLTKKFDQILKFDQATERFEDENQAIPYLRLLTDYRYAVEISMHRRWGSKESELEEGRFYQIVPDLVDDGFFDWYCDSCPEHQHFRTVEMALLHFVFFWHVWTREKTAKP